MQQSEHKTDDNFTANLSATVGYFLIDSPRNAGARFFKPVKHHRAKAVLKAIMAWRISPALRAYEWQFSPSYWRARRSVSKWLFTVRRWGFQTKTIFYGTLESGSIIVQMVKNIFWQFVWALIVVCALGSIDYFGENHKWFIFTHTLDNEAQLGFFTTLLQVSAGFLALYFTAISVVASTGYARAPGQIRFLVMQEQVGSFYFRTLAKFVGVVTVLLTALTLKWHIGILNTLFASCLCLFAGFSFVVLGIGMFRYFDPIALAPHLTRLIFKNVRAVTPSELHWKDASFQHHHQKQVQSLLGSYGDLVTMAADKDIPTTKGLQDLAFHLLAIFSTYAIEKRKIPTSSYWFKKRLRHKDWLLATYHEVDIALRTGTIPQPESEPDLMWVETEITNLLNRITRNLESRGDTGGLANIAMRLPDTMMALGQALSVEESKMIFDSVWSPALSLLTKELKPGEHEPLELRDSLALVEACSCGVINVILGVGQSVETHPVSQFNAQFETMMWASPDDVYKKPSLPRKALEECEWVLDRLDFERNLEKKIVTPDWFCRERPALAYTQFLGNAAQILVDQFKSTFVVACDALLTKKKFILAAQLIQRGLECSDKLTRTIGEMQSSHVEYLKLNRSKEWEWPIFDWQKQQQKIEKCREKMLNFLAMGAPHLYSTNDANLPDYFGQAYTILSDECVGAMLNQNEARFSELFPQLFTTALLAFEKLRQKIIFNQRNINIGAAPLQDLLAVSGYSLVFSALNGKNYEIVVKQSWDNYFLTSPGLKSPKDVISLLTVISEPNPGLAVREVVRTRWKGSVEQELERQKILGNRMDGYFSAPRKQLVRHPSPLVRAFISGGAPLFTEPEHVFLSVYLLKKAEAIDIERPGAVREFDRALEREMKRNETE